MPSVPFLCEQGNMRLATFGAFDQTGILVDDLDASIARWIAHSGVGPWTVFRNVRLDGSYHGEPTIVTIDVGLSYQGEMQIELIQVTNDAPSPYRGDDGRVLLGLHHLARIVDDLDGAVATAVAWNCCSPRRTRGRASLIYRCRASPVSCSSSSAARTCAQCVMRVSRLRGIGMAAIRLR